MDPQIKPILIDLIHCTSSIDDNSKSSNDNLNQFNVRREYRTRQCSCKGSNLFYKFKVHSLAWCPVASCFVAPPCEPLGQKDKTRGDNLLLEPLYTMNVPACI